MPSLPIAPEVVVEWLDARDWNLDTLSLEDVPGRVSLRMRHSKGWLVYTGPDTHGVEVHILASTFDPPEGEDEKPEYGDFTCIPLGWVRSVKYRTRKPRKAKDDGQGEPTKA